MSAAAGMDTESIQIEEHVMVLPTKCTKGKTDHHKVFVLYIIIHTRLLPCINITMHGYFTPVSLWHNRY